MKLRIFFLLFPLLCLAGCHKTEEGLEPNLITDEQAIEFSQTIEKSLTAGDPEPLIRAVNWSSLTDRVLAGIPEKDRGRFDRRYLIQLFSGSEADFPSRPVYRKGVKHQMTICPRTPALIYLLEQTLASQDISLRQFHHQAESFFLPF